MKISGVDQPRHRFCHVAVSYNESMFVFGAFYCMNRPFEWVDDSTKCTYEFFLIPVHQADMTVLRG